MHYTIRCLTLTVLATAAQSAHADVIISLFRTGDVTKSSAFTVTPGEVFSIDAEISSTAATPDDLLNAYVAEFTSTPLDASVALFTDQAGVAPYRSAADGYAFGDGEVAGGVLATPFLTAFDGALPSAVDAPLTTTPVLLARMELTADTLGTPGDSILIDLDTSPLSFTSFLSSTLAPVDVESVAPALVTISAVPEPSHVLGLGLLICGLVLRHRRTTVATAR